MAIELYRCPAGHELQLDATELEQIGTPFCSECEQEDVEMQAVEFDVQDDEGFQEWLQHVTFQLRYEWENAGGDKMGEFQAQALNDRIELFFIDRRRTNA